MAARRAALIAYGSVSGNAQEAAEELGRLTKRLHFSSRVVELNDLKLAELVRFDVVFFVISTTGQGDLPANALAFWKRLRSARLPPDCLARLRFASFGIGDSSYPQYNWAHRKLNNRLRQLGGVEVLDRGESDEQGSDGLEGLFAPWCGKAKETLLEIHPLPSGVDPIPESDFLQHDWMLQFSAGGESTLRETTFAPLPDGLDAELVSNRRLTPEDHWQDVRMFEFLTPQVDYSPGDTLSIYPKNRPDDVQQLISLMGWGDVADQDARLALVSDDGVDNAPSPIPHARTASSTSLRHILSDYLDITAVPRKSFFAAIAHFASDQEQRERLVEFTDVDLIDELYDYTTRPRRSIIEVLQEFDSVKIPAKWACGIFPVIRGRLFSIASGGKLKASADGRTRFQLLVAIVKYRTIIRKIRHGLCSRYLAALQPGQRLSVTLSKGPQMRASYERPAVMIGPGTGVAPLRAMIHECLEKTGPSRPQVLVFGCRNRSADFFFEDEWQRLEAQSDLKVLCAFSRDQATKSYVQDIVRSNASVIFPLLEEGVVYVCGSSGKMPEAVREAIISVIEQQGSLQRADAEARFQRMQKDGRYQQETW